MGGPHRPKVLGNFEGGRSVWRRRDVVTTATPPRPPYANEVKESYARAGHTSIERKSYARACHTSIGYYQTSRRHIDGGGRAWWPP